MLATGIDMVEESMALQEPEICVLRIKRYGARSNRNRPIRGRECPSISLIYTAPAPEDRCNEDASNSIRSKLKSGQCVIETAPRNLLIRRPPQTNECFV